MYFEHLHMYKHICIYTMHFAMFLKYLVYVAPPRANLPSSSPQESRVLKAMSHKDNETLAKTVTFEIVSRVHHIDLL